MTKPSLSQDLIKGSPLSLLEVRSILSPEPGERLRIDRRAFLKALAAIPAVAACIGVLDLDEPKGLAQAWDELVEEPVLFTIDHGTLALEGFKAPAHRKDFYFLSEWNFGTLDRMLLAAEACQPFRWCLQGLYDQLLENGLNDPEFLKEVKAELSRDPEAEYRYELEIVRAKQLAKPSYRWPEEIENVSPWHLSRVLGKVGRERFRKVAQNWLNEEPDYVWEEDYFDEEWSAQGFAFSFFDSGQGETVARSLGIRIVEYPGGTYQVAKLRIPLEEANTRAARFGLPIRFKQA